MKKYFKQNIGTNSKQVHGLSIKSQTQLQRIIRSFNECPKSMRMVEVQTDIMRPNICRYVKVLAKKGLIQKFQFSRCACTGRIVVFYTTDRRYFKVKQLRLF
jgi:predicted transcriptional regulator